MADVDGGGADALDVSARLVLRGLWPMRPRPTAKRRPKAKRERQPPAPKPVEVGCTVIAKEDFMSDSGAQDKVLLKTGQRGTVKKIIDSGHASIDFPDHKKLQWVAKANLHKLRVFTEEPPSPPSSDEGEDNVNNEGESEEGEEEYAPPLPSTALRCKVFSELNDALDSGFARRLERLERRFQLLQNGHAPNGSSVHQPSEGKEAPVMGRASTKDLSRAVKKALSSRSQGKRYGPSRRQSTYEDPPEKDEEILPESTTLHLTLQSLEQNVNGRRRQIQSLRAQAEVADENCLAARQQAEAAEASEKALQADASKAAKVHGDGLARRAARVRELRREQAEVEEKARSLRDIMIEQRRYLTQYDRVAQIVGGPHGLMRHKAGDVYMAPQPVPLDVEPPESWDVGTAIANPYNVDSWPFEPNVLARRTFNAEPTMDPFVEETPEDLDETRSRFRNPFLPGLRLPGRDEDEYEDEYGGPSATSRSL